MAGPLTACLVLIEEVRCKRKAMKFVTYDMANLPEVFNFKMTLQIPMCGYHLGIVADNGESFMQAMDELSRIGHSLTDAEIEEISDGNLSDYSGDGGSDSSGDDASAAEEPGEEAEQPRTERGEDG